MTERHFLSEYYQKIKLAGFWGDLIKLFVFPRFLFSLSSGVSRIGRLNVRPSGHHFLSRRGKIPIAGFEDGGRTLWVKEHEKPLEAGKAKKWLLPDTRDKKLAQSTLL